MGDLIGTEGFKRVVDTNLQHYIKQTTGRYSRLFNKSPTFTKYYSQDLVDSTADINLGGVIEFVGSESPLKFSSVDNFPLYGFPEADLTSAYDDVSGVNTGSQIAGEVHILPGTIHPIENDFFVIKYLETDLLFRIRQVDSDRIEGNPYFRVQYFLDVTAAIDIEQQVVDKNVFEMRHIGSDTMSPIISEESSLLIRRLTLIADRLKKIYWENFYDRACSTLMYQDAEKALHSRSLDIFVQRNNALSSEGYLNARAISMPEYTDAGLFETTCYINSLYGFAESKINVTTGAFYANKHIVTKPSDQSSSFYSKYVIDGYVELVPVDPEVVSTDDLVGWTDFPSTVAGTTTGLSNLHLLTYHCLSGYYDDGSLTKLSGLADALNDRDIFLNRYAAFNYLPIIFNEINGISSKIQRTNN